jgi:hypothetical protein
MFSGQRDHFLFGARFVPAFKVFSISNVLQYITITYLQTYLALYIPLLFGSAIELHNVFSNFRLLRVIMNPYGLTQLQIPLLQQF